MRKNKHGTAGHKFRIGNHIRKWRTLKEIKQKDLAFSLQLSEAAVSNIENDITNLTVAQLEDIALALDVSLEQLLSDPHERYGTEKGKSQDEQRALDKDLVQAVIGSLEKRDEQIQFIMQHFINTLNEMLLHEKLPFRSSKQVASRA